MTLIARHDNEPDDFDITDSPEFEGLLTKNVEALFTSKGVDEGFMVKLADTQVDNLGCDLITALVFLLKEFRPNRIHDHYYAMLLGDKLEELREEMEEIATAHVTEGTEQELNELIRHREDHKLASGY